MSNSVTEPMTKPVQIELPTPFSIGPVNSYLFIEPEPTLVDCGLKTEEMWQALQENLGNHGLSVADLKHLVITHAHVDHMGLAGRIVAESQAQLWVSDLLYRWAVDFHTMWAGRIEFMSLMLDKIGFTAERKEISLGHMRQIPTLWDAVPVERVRTFPVDGTIQMGGMAWQSIYTPGHCNTQSCFYQPDTRQLLAADMLLPKTPTPVIEQPLNGGYARIPGLPEFMRSLDLVEAMDIEWVYPGHGEPFTGHRQLIQRQRERIGIRKEECYELVKAGHETIPEMVDIMYSYLPQDARFNGLSMLIGYLDLLKLEERIIERETDDAVWHYSAIE